MHRLLALVVFTLGCLAGTPSFAQSPDLDEPDRGRGRGATASTAEAVAREIERGVYLKANAGSTILVGPRRALLKAGTTLDLTIGMDVLDKAKASAGWEIVLTQSIHNATFASYEDLPGSGIPEQFFVQGDTYMLGLMVGGGGQYYPVRRLGIGGRGGVGIAYLPLLIERTAYANEVVPAWGVDPRLYNSVKVMFQAGPSLEYYTKLSHFSFGLNVDFLYVLGFDYGIKATGFFKYSF